MYASIHIHLPWHGLAKHCLDPVDIPTHGRPSLDGVGKLHDLDRFSIPFPQSTEQRDQLDQLPQPPLTRNTLM